METTMMGYMGYRVWGIGIWGSYHNIPKAIFYLLGSPTIRTENLDRKSLCKAPKDYQVLRWLLAEHEGMQKNVETVILWLEII